MDGNCWLENCPAQKQLDSLAAVGKPFVAAAALSAPEHMDWISHTYQHYLEQPYYGVDIAS